MVSNRGKKLKIICSLVILFTVALMPLADISDSPVQAAEPLQPQEAPRLPPPEQPLPPKTGGRPPEMDLSHLTGREMPEEFLVQAQALPASWDWRTQGKVNSVKDQGACGSCYAFAAIGNIESKMLMDGAGSYDFSENNAKECNWRELSNYESPPGYLWGSCSRGNYAILANLFSQKGVVLESCDQYVPADVDCNDACPYQITLLDWRLICGNVVPNTDVLKSYIQTYGPVTASMYADSSQGFSNSYDGSYTFNYFTSPALTTNHDVLIVGWSNNLPHVPGGVVPADGWIVKNSWGPGWGDDGYFYITYGSANIGMYSSFMYGWQDYDNSGSIMYYDDDGWWSGWGWSPDTTAWGLAKFFPASDTNVSRVEFWTTDKTTDVDVYIYDNFDGTAPSNLLWSSLDNSFNEAGYHGVTVNPPLAVNSGDDVIAVVKFTNNSYGYPIPVDANSPYVTGHTYISHTGASGTWSDLGADHQADVAIRLRTSDTPPGQPDITVSPPSFDVTLPPDTIQDYTLTIGNSGGATITYDISDRETTVGLSAAGGESLFLTGPASKVLEVPLESSPVEPEEIGASGWQNIKTDGFEGAFPGDWVIWVNPSAIDAYWGRDGYRYHSGSYSAFCAKSGPAGVNPPSNYPNNMQAWMIYGPFSLADATDAELNFYHWVDTEYNYDYFYSWASIDGSHFYGWGYTGDFGGWVSKSFDLTDVYTLGNLCGQPQVWVAFVFESDEATTDKGAFVDDVVLRKYVGAANNPPNMPSSPSPAHHATGVSVDADLGWTGGDPDAGDTVTYDVYFDTTGATTLVSNDQPATTYDPGTLNPNTKYYWKIDATDNHAALTTGLVWDFTTTSGDCLWLDENPKSGSVPAGGSNDITVTINTAGLTVGNTYTAEIVIANNDPDENPKIVPVTLHVGAQAPTVTTNAATNEEETTATLNGVINSDGGEACQYQFEYDTDSGEPYAYNTGWTGNKTTGQSFSESITSLNKGTKYYFRAQAKNSAGTASGSELSFLTKPDAPTSFSASTVSSTQIDLSWTNGAGAQKTKIQRKVGSYPSNRDDGTQVYFDTGTSTPDTGLTSGTTYYYRAWSYVQGSEQWSDNYAEDSAATSGVTPPTVTTNAATNEEETTATLNSAISNDGGEACQYRFEYDVDSGEPYAYNTGWTGSKTTGQSFNAPITSLSKGTKYYFRAQAKNSAGTGSGSELSFLTKPDAPTSFSASTVSSTQIDLSWTKGAGAQKTKIQRKVGSYPSNRDDGTQVYFDTGTSKSDTGLTPGTTYYYRAWSWVSGSEQWSDNCAEDSATTSGVTPPTVTTNAATSVEETTATLNSTLSNDGGEACQYRFEYDTDSGAPYAYNTGWTGSKTTGQSFSESITSLTKGTKYYFRAQAKNSAGTASGSELSFLTKPDAPTSFSASTVNSTQIDLSWAKGAGAQKTKIQRKEGGYPSDKDDGTQAYFGTGTSTPDMGLTPGTTYYYRAWSWVSGSEQWSDNYAEDSATTESEQPDISVTPTSFNVTLPLDTSYNYTLTISNDGNATLTYDISDREMTGEGSGAGAISQTSQAGPAKKGEAEAEAEGALQLAPGNPDFLAFQQNPPEPFYGYIPPPMDLSHLDEIPVERARGLATLPSSFDWRDTGKVTSVKDQNPCGTCWIFGTTSVLESAALIGEDVAYNFSEQSVAMCVDRSWVSRYDDADDPCNAGGWSWLASEVFINKGAVLESCNPYDGSGLQCDGSCACDNCIPVKKVTGYRMIANNATSPTTIEPIKNAVYSHGSLAMSYAADGPNHMYPGNIYYWPSCPQNEVNHLVCIIGWDDSIEWPDHSGSGAWIVKNSWGTGWGNSGYFYLCYGSAGICEVASLDYRDYDPDETLYYWDEAGIVDAVGLNVSSAWMANIFTAAQDGDLTHVDFWTTSNNAEYQIYVYMDGDISDGLDNRVASQSGTCQEFGYYSIALTPPVSLSNGQSFTIAVKMTTPDWEAPIPLEFEIPGFVEPPIQIGVSYTRLGDTDAWEDIGLFGANVCLRARVNSAAGEDCPWLEESPESGSVEPGGSHGITVTIDTTGLAEGNNYSAEIVIDSNDPDENPTTVPVTLRLGVPYLALDITYPENGDKFYGGDEPEQFVLTAVVKNVGDANYAGNIPVNMSAVGPVTPTSGSTTITGGLAAGESRVVTFNMTAGATTGNAVIAVTATGPNTALDVVIVKIDLEPTQVLYAGANPIAYQGKTMSLPQALTNISDKLEIIWQRDVSTGGEWHTFYFYHEAPVGEITELENGRAYIMVVTEDCTWELPH